MNLILEYLFPTTSEAKKKVDFIHIITQITILVALLILMNISTPAFVFFSIATMPTIIFMFLDRKNPYKFASATISAFNFLGMLPYLIAMTKNLNNFEHYTLTILTEIQTWLVIYGASIIGKMVYILLPNMILKYEMQKIHNEKLKLIQKKEQLRKSWGIKGSDMQ